MHISDISIGGAGLCFPPPDYAYDCNLNAICDIKILCAFLPLCACQSGTNGSISYEHAKYVILLVKVKIVLNSSCNVHDFNFFTIFNCVKTYFLLRK